MNAKGGRTELEDGICDLMIGEGRRQNRIGVWTKENPANSNCDYPTIRDWLDVSDFHAVVWTNLKGNFKKKRKVIFSLDGALDYLESLSPVCKANARNYINKAPAQTDTRLRQHLKITGCL